MATAGRISGVAIQALRCPGRDHVDDKGGRPPSRALGRRHVPTAIGSRLRTHVGRRRYYDATRESMFFGEVPDFAEILSVLGGFEEDFNSPPHREVRAEPQS